VSIHPKSQWRSLGRAIVDLDLLLAGSVHLERLPDEFDQWDRARQRDCAARFLERCDVVVGTQRQAVSRCRRELHPDGGGPRFVEHTLGDGGRAGQMTMRIRPYLRTTDVLVSSCHADRSAMLHLLPNADIRAIPCWIDRTVFTPADPESVAGYRRAQRFAPDDRIVLYVGRILLEKNVHSLVRAFRCVLEAEPRALLVLVGPFSAQADEFSETGVLVRDYRRVVKGTASALGVPPGRIRIMPFQDQRSLPLLYGAADVTVSLSIYHDEDFGYALVESMACGTPVVASAWGGHRDAIVDGVTGFLAGTSATAGGVKVDWWAAVDRIVGLLHDERLRRELGANGVGRAARTYDPGSVRERYLAVLRQAAAPAGPGEPLRTSEAAERLWSAAGGPSGLRYRFGRPSFEAYEDLVRHYTGPAPGAAPRGPLVLCSPVRLRDAALVVDDPLYPFVVPVPADLLEAARAVLRVMRRRPVLLEAELREATPPAARQRLGPCLDLLERLGVLVRSQVLGTPEGRAAVPGVVTRPVLRYGRVDEAVDCIVPR